MSRFDARLRRLELRLGGDDRRALGAALPALQDPDAPLPKDDHALQILEYILAAADCLPDSPALVSLEDAEHALREGLGVYYRGPSRATPKAWRRLRAKVQLARARPPRPDRDEAFR